MQRKYGITTWTELHSWRYADRNATREDWATCWHCFGLALDTTELAGSGINGGDTPYENPACRDRYLVRLTEIRFGCGVGTGTYEGTHSYTMRGGTR